MTPGNDDGDRRPPADPANPPFGDADSIRLELPNAGTGARARLRAARDAHVADATKDDQPPGDSPVPSEPDDPAEPSGQGGGSAEPSRFVAPLPPLPAEPARPASGLFDHEAVEAELSRRIASADRDDTAASAAPHPTLDAPAADLDPSTSFDRLAVGPIPPAPVDLQPSPSPPTGPVPAVLDLPPPSGSAAAESRPAATPATAETSEVDAPAPESDLEPEPLLPLAEATGGAEAAPTVAAEAAEIRRLFDVFPAETVSFEPPHTKSAAAPVVDTPESPAPDTDDEADDDEDGSKRRRRSRRVASPPPRPAAWRRVLFAAVLVVLFGAGATLAYVGSETVRGSTDGRVVSVTDDPSAPGYEAFVTPSPTMLLIHRDETTVLGYTLLVLGPNDQGGAIVFIPTKTLGELDTFGLQPLALAYEGGGVPVATQVIQDMLGTGILEVLEIDDPRWTTLTEPVAPFGFDNPDQVVAVDPETGEEGVLFPAGPIDLEAVGVGQYLSKSNPGESELARLARDEILWTQWLAAIAESGDEGSVPGEVDSGIGRFVRGLASGPAEIYTLPVDEFVDPGGGDTLFIPREAQIEALVTDIIPLPTSPAFGVRPKIRLLNGTPDPDVLGPLVTPLVEAGAELTVFGNASTFSETTTQIIFTDVSFSDDARAYRDALGIGEIVRSERPVENVDITIVIGTDYTGPA